MNRPSKDETFMEMALVLARRSTCIKRSVGCVLVNEKGHVLATGYNGVARELPHCAGIAPCYNHHMAGEDDGCMGIHAEINALVQCRSISELHTCYVTCAPCRSCMKALMATPCQHIVYKEAHPSMPQCKLLWESMGRLWQSIQENEL